MLRRWSIATLVFLLSVAGAQAATPGQRLLLLSGCPAQVQVKGICPSLGMNFQTGTYYAQGIGSVPLPTLLSITRASSHLCQYANGTLISVTSNILCVTDQGALIEEARTNKSTNFNANPTDLTNVTKSGDAAATLTVVDDTAALLAAGLQNIASSGKVYKLDNSAGVGLASAIFSGTVGNTNPHILSVYIRGTGTVNLRINIAGTTYSLTSNYLRKTDLANPPSASGRASVVEATAGTIVYFILNQLEEGAFVTSPIVIAGASAARAKDDLTPIGPLATALANAKSLYSKTTGGEGGTNPRFVNWSGGANIGFQTTNTVRISDGTTPLDATLGSGTSATSVKAAFGFDSSGLSAIANAGTKTTSATVWANNSGTVTLYGNGAGTRMLNAYAQQLTLSPSKGVFDGSTTP